MPRISKNPARTTVKADGPSPVDVHVGGRVKLRRVLLGISQDKLGTAIGLTFQQIQKYERGFNRISASKLWKLSQVLDVPVSFFFDGLDGAVIAASSSAPSRLDLEFQKNFSGLPDGVRKSVHQMVKALARAQTGETVPAAE